MVQPQLTKNKFLIFSEFAELLDLAIWLKEVEKQEVYMHIPSHDYQKIGEGMINKVKDWYMCLGKGYIWVFDGCANGKLQDWLRSRGEFVFGGTETTDKLENDRQLGQKLFKSAGFKQTFSKNFKSIDEAITFVKENRDKRWILKQNGDAPKSLNHMGKFEANEDMLFHLEELKKKWNESQFGKFDCDLMEVVEGLEVAASAFFNGKDWIRNKEGKVVGFLNFEEKKEANGQTGETTGEMGTTFIGVTEDNKLFADIILRPKIVEVLKATGFKGVFDINGSKTKDGYVAFEPTCRFGIPATSYEFMEGLKTPCHELISSIARGESNTIEIKQGIGMVMVIAAKPYPVEVDLADGATSLGERLWILNNGKPAKDFTSEQLKHIHLQNFYKEDDYKVATKNGYLLTVTFGAGMNIPITRENLIKYIKDNIYIAGMKYRTDIGERVEGKSGATLFERMKTHFDKKLEEEKSKLDEVKKQSELEVTKAKEEVSKIKQVLTKTIYGDNEN